MDCRDGLVGKCFAIYSKHGGLGFTLRTHIKMSGMTEYACNGPQLWAWGDRQIDPWDWLASLDCLISPRPVRNPFSK